MYFLNWNILEIWSDGERSFEQIWSIICAPQMVRMKKCDFLSKVPFCQIQNCYERSKINIDDDMKKWRLKSQRYRSKATG